MNKFDEFFDNITLLSSSLECYKKNQDKLVDQINNLTDSQKDQLDNIIGRIHDIGNKMDDINNDIEGLQYEIDKNLIHKSPQEKQRIREYEDQKRIMDIFGPILICYNMMMKNNRV